MPAQGRQGARLQVAVGKGADCPKDICRRYLRKGMLRDATDGGSWAQADPPAEDATGSTRLAAGAELEPIRQRKMQIWRPGGRVSDNSPSPCAAGVQAAARGDTDCPAGGCRM